MGVDENRPQAFHPEAFDEPHAAHVRRQVVNFHGAFANAPAILLNAHVQTEVLRSRRVEVPLIQRFLVHRAKVGKSFLAKMSRQIASDESTGAQKEQRSVLLCHFILTSQFEPPESALLRRESAQNFHDLRRIADRWFLELSEVRQACKLRQRADDRGSKKIEIGTRPDCAFHSAGL